MHRHTQACIQYIHYAYIHTYIHTWEIHSSLLFRGQLWTLMASLHFGSNNIGKDKACSEKQTDNSHPFFPHYPFFLVTRQRWWVLRISHSRHEMTQVRLSGNSWERAGWGNHWQALLDSTVPLCRLKAWLHLHWRSYLFSLALHNASPFWWWQPHVHSTEATRGEKYLGIGCTRQVKLAPSLLGHS